MYIHCNHFVSAPIFSGLSFAIENGFNNIFFFRFTEVDIVDDDIKTLLFFDRLFFLSFHFPQFWYNSIVIVNCRVYTAATSQSSSLFISSSDHNLWFINPCLWKNTSMYATIDTGWWWQLISELTNTTKNIFFLYVKCYHEACEWNGNNW